jgi:hypothetical protein
MCIASVGQNGTNPWFWTLSSTQMTDTAAAAGIAAINSVGNLGSFIGPHVVGWIKDTTQSFDGVGGARAARPMDWRCAPPQIGLSRISQLDQRTALPNQMSALGGSGRAAPKEEVRV